jgi:hypothetical protein
MSREINDFVSETADAGTDNDSENTALIDVPPLPLSVDIMEKCCIKCNSRN